MKVYINHEPEVSPINDDHKDGLYYAFRAPYGTADEGVPFGAQYMVRMSMMEWQKLKRLEENNPRQYQFVLRRYMGAAVEVTPSRPCSCK